MKKRIIGLVSTLVLSCTALTGCSSSETESTGGVFNMGVSFWYEMDAHKDYNGWYTSMYGVTETLFKVADDYTLEGWIAESGTSEGNTWTITLKDDVVFSNGDAVTADVVIENLQRAGEVNSRATVFADATYEAIDDTTLTITTAEACPTLLSDLTDPYTSIMDIDAVANDDYNNGIIATGPFVLSSYTAESTVSLVKNESYWDGDVAMDEVNVFYIPDSSTEATSLQSGEIDMYVGPDTDSLAIFTSDSTYTVTSVGRAMANYYIFNMDTMTDLNVRKAIMMSINKDDIVTMMNNTMTAATAAYGPTTELGQVDAPEYDVAGAQALLEASGYALDANGYYAKDGEELVIRLAYYTAKSTDKITTLIQDQLKSAGINTSLELYEDPDATYMSTGDFDMGMYAHGTTSSGDAYAFLNVALSTDGNINAGNYSNSQLDALLVQLANETDSAARTELAVQIQQIATDDCAVGFYAIPNKITVMKATVSNVSENNPLTIYALNKDTSVTK